MSLTKSLRWEIQHLAQRLASAANAEELARKQRANLHDKARSEQELKRIVLDIRKLLDRIEDAVPLINLAITASGASLSSTLPSTVSPSRLLQASAFLTAGDAEYSFLSSPSVQIGPTFTLSLYMLFLGHVRPQNEEEVRESIWKEVIHKANVKLLRVPIDRLHQHPWLDVQADPHSSIHNDRAPPAPPEDDSEGSFVPHIESETRGDEYAYQLLIVEDLNDDRVHTFDENEIQPSSYGDVVAAGIREALPIHQISKIFYADTGKILNIGNEGETNSPVLLLKRDPYAIAPRRMMNRRYETDVPEYDSMSSLSSAFDHNEHSTDGANHEATISLISQPIQSSIAVQPLNPWRFPPDLDPEWMAFEVYTESADSDSESDSESTSAKPRASLRSPSLDPQLTSALSRLDIKNISTTPIPSSPHATASPSNANRPTLPPIRTSLSLLETLLRLLSLQQFQQAPHLSIPDELLTFFLSESSSTGASNSDAEERRRLRTDARRRVGFDPYDESPIKRRGEDYQRTGHEGPPWDPDNEDGSNFYDQYAMSNERHATPLRYARSPRFPATESHDRSSPSAPFPELHRASAQTPPQTPPLPLKNGPRSLISMTPSPRRGGIRYLQGGGEREVRKGSPLARPSTGTTDEGLGTSPASEPEGKKA